MESEPRNVGLDATAAFWSSYVLTRPLGASVADWLGKPPRAGGLGWGDGAVFVVGLGLFAGLVTWLAVTHSDTEGAHRMRRDLHQLEELGAPDDVEPDLATD